MSLFKSFKIQRMQVFRPEIEQHFCCCYFKSFDRNLIFHEPVGVFLQLIVLKNFTGDARTSAETSAKAQVLISPWNRPWHKKWSNHKRKPIRTFPFSCACSCACFNIFSWKRNTKLKTKECSWAVFFINQQKHSFWVRSWFYQDGRGWRKFEERVSETVYQFPVTVFTRSRYKDYLLLLAYETLFQACWPDTERTFHCVS